MGKTRAMTGAIIITKDGVYQRFGKALDAIGEGKSRRAFSSALNRGGDMARTQVKRSLVAQTGIAYGQINKAVKTERSTPGTLSYSLIATGSETNLGLFKAKQAKKGVSAAPWKVRRIFRSTFIVPKYGGKVYKRSTDERGPLHPLFGPNIAREITREPTLPKWRQVDGYVMQRIEHELMRIFKL